MNLDLFADLNFLTLAVLLLVADLLGLLGMNLERQEQAGNDGANHT